MLQLYEETAVQNIADKIRQEMSIEDKMSILEMPDYIGQLASSFGINIDIVPSHLDTDGNWVRPEEYEDLSQIELDDFREEVYLSLYNRHDGLWHLGLYVTASKGYKVELGHIVNGAFVASSEYLKANNAYFEILLPEEEETMVARVTSQNPLYGITAFRFGRIAKATSGRVIDVPYYYQPVVERIGRLPYVTNFSLSSTTYGYGSCYIEHDAIKVGYQASVTTLASAFNNCYNLQKLEVSDWDTSHWKVTSLAYTFNNCYSLEKLDLSSWDTTNWVVTALNGVFGSCLYLKELKQNWDTTNWKVTTTSASFSECYSIEEIDLSNWDVSNWKPTTLSNMFSNTRSLKSIDLSNWDVSGWPINASVESMFRYCYNLQSLDLSSWQAQNFKPATVRYFVDDCYKLKYLNLSTLNDTSSAYPITFTNTMYSLTEYYPPIKSNQVNFTVGTNNNLSHDSLMRIINGLPTTTSAHTVTLGNLRAKLTADEIAIATQKGWTVA